MKVPELILSFVLFFIFLSGQANAQRTSGSRSGLAASSREFNISVSGGYSFLGPQNDIEAQMSASGLDDTSPGFFGSPQDHPHTNKGPAFDIEGVYFFSRNSGVALNIGLADYIEVKGYEEPTPNLIGNFIFLRSRIWPVSPLYVYRSGNNRHNLAIGPSLFIHNVKDTRSGANSPGENNLIPGFHAGYSFKIILKRRWFILFKSNFRWAPDSEIGPFVNEGLFGVSTFQPAKVNMACLNVGLAVGFRVY